MEDENVSLKIYNFLDIKGDEVCSLFQTIQTMFLTRMKINRNYVLCFINEKPVSYASFHFVDEKSVVIGDYTNGDDYVGITILLKNLIRTFLSKKNDLQIYVESIDHIHIQPIMSFICYSTTSGRKPLFHQGSYYHFTYVRNFCLTSNLFSIKIWSKSMDNTCILFLEIQAIQELRHQHLV